MLYKILQHQKPRKSNFYKFNLSRLLSTVSEQIEKWTKKLKEENISEPESSVKNLLAHLLNTRNLEVVDHSSQTKLNDIQIRKLESMCLARLCHMPVQYIIKEWDFRDLKGIKMSPPVFIPRPETEEMVSLVIDDLRKQNADAFRFLEIGCGSGVISLSLLNAFSKARCVAIDQSKMAIDLTKENAEKFNLSDRLSLEQHKISDENIPQSILEQEFDLIVSNPPYLLSRELFDLADEIKLFEDLRAVDGGRDGLAVINSILNIANKCLKPSGYLWLEVHPTHPEIIKKYLSDKMLTIKVEKVFKDFCEKDRFIKIKKN